MELFERNPDIFGGLREDRCRRLCAAFDLVFRSARSRLARILIQLADDFGRKQDDGILVDLELTHVEVAKLTGTTRPTVSIALGELEDEGLGARDRGRFRILQPQALRSLAKEQT